MDSKTDLSGIFKLFKQLYASVIQVDLEKDSKENVYGVVLFNDQNQYFHAMQTMFFNLNGSLLMAISVLDEISQKDGLSRVLKMRFDNQEKGSYLPRIEEHFSEEIGEQTGNQLLKFLPQGPNFNSGKG